jgi:energy-coupling factor transport system permease protein
MAARTTNLVILLLIGVVTGVVATACRIDGPVGRSYWLFLRIAVGVVLIRLLLQIVFAPRLGGDALFTIPSIQLPAWMAGISIGGPVTAESLMSGLSEGLRLAVILLCFGAVNSVSSPARLVRALPSVLYEAGVATTIALTTAPQAVLAAAAIHEGRRLRGRATSGPAALRGVAVPVLDGALDRALAVAASMDVRGYGRVGNDPLPARRHASIALGVGLLAAAIGVYGVFDPTAPAALSIVGLTVGTTLLAIGVFTGRAASVRTRHRSLRWDGRAWLITASGIIAVTASIVVGLSDPAALDPSYYPLTAQRLPLLVALGCAIALIPAFLPQDRR